MDRREVVAGWAAGAAGQLVGHPFDTVKVRMQTDPGGVRDTGAWRCSARIWREGGVRGFFRGLSLPLMGKSVEQCVIFGVRGTAERCLAARGWQEGQARAGASGAAAGAVASLLMTPVQVVKVQLQVTRHEGLPGPLAAACRAVAKRGVTGLYTGAAPNLAATVISCSTRFAFYQGACEAVAARGFGRTVAAALGGGLAGCGAWAACFPLDTIITRMQSRAVDRTSRRLSIRGHVRELLAEQGVLGLYRGFMPCMLRAFPVSATLFVSYEAAVGSLP